MIQSDGYIDAISLAFGLAHTESLGCREDHVPQFERLPLSVFKQAMAESCPMLLKKTVWDEQVNQLSISLPGTYLLTPMLTDNQGHTITPANMKLCLFQLDTTGTRTSNDDLFPQVLPIEMYKSGQFTIDAHMTSQQMAITLKTTANKLFEQLTAQSD